MVLVDFTLAERWRVFGELRFAAIPRAVQRPHAGTALPVVTAPAAPGIDPAEAPARRQAEAALMQRLL